MRKVGLGATIGIIVMIILYLFLKESMPKDVSRLPFLVGLLILDMYLWSSLRKFIFLYHKAIIYSLMTLYWLPALALIGSAISSFFIDFDSWNDTFRTYFIGTIFVFYVAKMVPLLFLFLNDLLRLIRYIIHLLTPKSQKQIDDEFRNSRSKFLRQFSLITGGIFLGSLIMGMVKWAYDFKIWKHRVSLPNLPQSFNGFRVVQISDMHLGTMATENSLKEAVRMINELKPDVIFFTGDLVNYATSEAFRFQHVLADLEAKHGIYATLGNHDYGDYKKWDSAEEKQENMEDLYDFFRDLRWKLLNNENDVIEMNGEQIAVLGVENWSAYPRFPKRGDMKKALKDVGSVPVKLLLSHDPTHFSSEVVQSYPEIDIAFAGHTHGMQFGIEIPGVKWSPAKYMYKHWAGLYEDTRHGKPQYLYVNRGLGVIGYPGRIGIMPEITLMELTKA